MPVRPYQETALWKGCLADRKKGDPYQRARSHLRAAYESFRIVAGCLTNEIHTHLPNLTVHNVDHLDALWDVASEILGPNCAHINPMEAFILGGAFLLHDAGMALAAFPGRMNDLKSEVRWRDAVIAAYRRRGVEEPSEKEVESLTRAIEEEAAFDVLHALHAQKAEFLAHLHWKHPSTGAELPMLSDVALRESHGHLIGKIAASHHWDVNAIPNRFGDKLVPPTHPYPREWTIDPIKLACIIRCADAANIDETRAPSYLYAMRRPGGISDDHWGFQNQLLSAHRNGDALEFRSKRPFEEAQFGKWWLAHDCISYLDKELAKCAALLTENNRPAFPAYRAAGAGDPSRLKQYIEVSGWSPVNTEIKVTDVKALVERLGGKQLYGDNPIVPLRELIQNAADAIRARRVLDNKYRPSTNNEYPGQITISVTEDSDDPTKVWISVEDDGIGMTQRVLTGHLLDFGKSLWRSDEVTEMFPGLSGSSNFKPTGQFGIGFFSVFMYSDLIRVISKPWREGENALQTLEFPNGLKTRALLREYKPKRDGQLRGNVCTKVSVRMSRDKYHEMKKASELDERVVSLAARIGRLCIALEVSILVEDENSDLRRAHLPAYSDMDGVAFLSQLVMLEDRGPSTVWDAIIKPLASRLRPLRDKSGRSFGRAAIYTVERTSTAAFSFGDLGNGISVGGFLTERSLSQSFIGLLEGSAVSAARSAGQIAVPASVLKEWASEQALLIGKSDLNEMTKLHAASRITEYGGDASQTAYILRNGSPVSLAKCVALLEQHGSMAFIVNLGQKMRIEPFPSEPQIIGAEHGYALFVEDEVPGVSTRIALSSEIDVDVCHADLQNRQGDSSYYYASSDYGEISSSNGFLRYLLTGIEEKGRRVALRVERDQVVGRYKEHDIVAHLLIVEAVSCS
jgi:hypothetical protein